MLRRSIVSALMVFLVLVGEGSSQPEKKDPGVKELWALLKEPVNLQDYAWPMSLKETLQIFQHSFRVKGKELPILVIEDAFKEENPDAPDIFETPIQLPPVPRSLNGFQFLNQVLSKIPTNNVTFLIKPGVVEITTVEWSRPQFLLGQKIYVRFQHKPLHLALDDIYEMTGVAAVLDNRVGPRARFPITGTFTNDISLGATLRIMADMAGLKLVVVDEVIFITTPPLAQQFLWERAWYLYLAEQTGNFQWWGRGYLPGGKQKRMEITQ